ncbi:hypothetical protein MDA_GLEAN10017051 [Myotis davidii]|uniref:Uncharacterized protein n=1 Tax=Myotis davidii TaxID=225400 RepID=L5LG08_MYODS|nr:hypothetical protein MDA_GLEAN10017051 [Myotis davidii]
MDRDQCRASGPALRRSLAIPGSSVVIVIALGTALRDFIIVVRS